MNPKKEDLRLQLLDRASITAEQYDRNILDFLDHCEAEFGELVPLEIRHKIEILSAQLNDLYQAIGGLEP